MKKLLIIASIFMIIVTGCSTIKKPHKADIKQKEKKEIVPVKEIYYKNNGLVEKYKILTYDNEMNLICEDIYNSFDKIIESSVYKKISEIEQEVLIFNTRGELKSSKKISVSPKTYLNSRIELFKNNGVLVQITEYKYNNEGQLLSEKVKDSDNSVLTVKEFYYENGLNIRIDTKDLFNNLSEYSKLKYTGNMLVEERVFTANGDLNRIYKYTNNKDGYPAKKEIFSKEGNLKGMVIFEYKNIGKKTTRQ